MPLVPELVRITRQSEAVGDGAGGTADSLSRPNSVASLESDGGSGNGGGGSGGSRRASTLGAMSLEVASQQARSPALQLLEHMSGRTDAMGPMLSNGGLLGSAHMLAGAAQRVTGDAPAGTGQAVRGAGAHSAV